MYKNFSNYFIIDANINITRDDKLPDFSFETWEMNRMADKTCKYTNTEYVLMVYVTLITTNDRALCRNYNQNLIVYNNKYVELKECIYFSLLDFNIFLQLYLLFYASSLFQLSRHTLFNCLINP